jgi:transposase
MPTEARMTLYAGLDLHKSNVFCGIKDQEGKRIYRQRLPTQLPMILYALEPYRRRLKAVAVESTFNWYWLVDGLQEAGYSVQLANPAAMQAYEGLKQTNDESDAFWLAEMLRLGILPVGYIYPKAERPVRDMLRRRLLIVRQATQTLLSLQSMVTRHNGQPVVRTPIEQWLLAEVRASFSDPHSRDTAAVLLELLREQRRLQRNLEQQVLTVVKGYQPYRRLLSIPGIGRILGLTITLETGPIARFASAGDYASYCRAVNSCCESDGKKKGENNRKNGNKYLGWAYVEAAHFAQRYNARAHTWFQRKQARAGRVVAVKALACKLSKAAYYVMRDEVDFDEEKMFGGSNGGGRKPQLGLVGNHLV